MSTGILGCGTAWGWQVHTAGTHWHLPRLPLVETLLPPQCAAGAREGLEQDPTWRQQFCGFTAGDVVSRECHICFQSQGAQGHM